MVFCLGNWVNSVPFNNNKKENTEREIDFERKMMRSALDIKFEKFFYLLILERGGTGEKKKH